MLIPIIHDNPDFLVANKPTDLSFHQQDGLDGLQRQLETQTAHKLWPVHRLDKITSGVIIFAKSASAAAVFGNLFEHRQIAKTYLALSDRKPKKKMGKVIGDMAKSRSGGWKLTQLKTNPAITEFKSQALTPGIRLFVIKPTTGKTHQIRVALKSLGAPILGDIRYAGTPADRGYLHSYSLQFNWNDSLMKFKAWPNSGQHFSEANATRLSELVEPLQS